MITKKDVEQGFILEVTELFIQEKKETLYKKTSTGAIQKWDICVIHEHEEFPNIVVVWGQRDGRKQMTTEEVLVGKNIGKANETSPWDQAVAQMESIWLKKMKKGYVTDLGDAEQGKVDSSVIKGGIPPMLAHKYWEQAKKIKFPALLQPKLDGHRCIAQMEWDDITTFYSLWSRGRGRINSVPHISQAIKEVLRMLDLESPYLDGELYNHDYKDNFEDLTSFIRQDEPKAGHEVVEYHVYDLPNDKLTNFERYKILEKLRPFFKGTPIHIVETFIVNNHEELMEKYEYFMELGYEGAMVRNFDGLYKYKKSYDLQKVKKYDDDEFIIKGIKVGTKGKMKGKAIFICKRYKADCPMGEDTTFDCKMTGDSSKLTDYANDPSLVIGKVLTVQFQGYTKKNKVPRFPVALRFREDI